MNTVPPLPERRAAHAAAAHSTQVLVVGGFNTERHRELNRLDVYDVQKNTWTQKANMPTARFFLSAEFLGEELYVVGGGWGIQDGIATVERYNPDRDSWGGVSGLPIPRSRLAVCAYQGKLWTLGGYSKAAGNHAVIEIFDPRTGKWAKGPPLPVAKHGLGAAVLNQTIHVFGGEPGNEDHWVLQNDKWKALAKLPRPMLFHGWGVVNNKLYVMGGHGNGVSKLVHEYDPVRDAWTRKGDMPIGRSRYATAVVQGKIYAIGGEIDEESVSRYDPRIDRWE